MSSIPRILWAFYDNVPKQGLVRNCLDSWYKTLGDTGWEIRVLDFQTYSKYLDPEDLPKTFPILHYVQMKSDCIRIALMKKYGGVYLDLSSLLVRDFGWIEDLIYKEGKDFLVYSTVGYDNGKDTFLENWFMAARKNSWFAHKVYEIFKDGIDQYGSLTDELVKKHYIYRDLPTKFHQGYWFQAGCMMWVRLYDEQGKSMFKQGKIWVGKAEDGPFWLSHQTGWDLRKIRYGPTLEQMKTHEKQVGFPIPFFKFSQSMRKELMDLQGYSLRPNLVITYLNQEYKLLQDIPKTEVGRVLTNLSVQDKSIVISASVIGGILFILIIGFAIKMYLHHKSHKHKI